MRDTPSPTPSAAGQRLAFLLSLIPESRRPTAREVDRACVPPLGSGHTAKLLSGAIESPTTDTLERVADVLGCPLAWLVSGAGRAPGRRAVAAAYEAARSRAAEAPPRRKAARRGRRSSADRAALARAVAA